MTDHNTAGVHERTTVTRVPRVPLGVDLVIPAAATICALVTWLVAVPIGGVDLIAHGVGGPQHIGPVAVALSTVLAGLAGVGILRLLERFTSRALTIWTIGASGLFIVSLVGTLGAASLSAMGTLIALHAVVAAVVIVAVHRSRSAWSRQRGGHSG